MVRKEVSDGLVVVRDTEETAVTRIHRRLDDFGSQIPHNRSLMIVGQWQTANLEHGQHQREKGGELWFLEIDAREKDVQAAGSGIGSSCSLSKETGRGAAQGAQGYQDVLEQWVGPR